MMTTRPVPVATEYWFAPELYDRALHRLAAWWTMGRSAITPADAVLGVLGEGV